MMRWSEEPLTRRQLLGLLGGGAAGAVLLSGCDGSTVREPSPTGSTRETTWRDPLGDGQLRVAAGEPLVQRDELGGPARLTRQLGTVGHLTDAHVMDACSPARVTFLARLGSPFESTFRAQEALTARVLAGSCRAMAALAPDLVIQGEVHPGSGPDGGYYGVQSSFDPDPFYYRPEVDAPRHPSLLRDAMRPLRTGGVRVPVLPVLGDHDILAQGELVPTELTRHLAVGDRALWTLPEGLTLPKGLRLQSDGSPDGPPLPGMVDQFLLQALSGTTVEVPPNPERAELAAGEVIARLRDGARRSGAGEVGFAERLDYVRDLGDRLRLVVLDFASRVGGSAGRRVDGQREFLAEAIEAAAAAGRWVIFISHQKLGQTVGGDELQALLDRSSNVVMTLAGHTHHNRIAARATPAGGYWTIETASLIDWPQQSRALRFWETEDGGVAIETWMLDHVDSGPGAVGRISRELSYLSATGGRPGRFAGGPGDRNAVLFRRAA
jgi:hypothetical protein